ncbi:hypothetical protein FB45DRAFT_1054977 [Roridomyces roridus]|uniref:Cytochrome c oxidase subunit 8, mitochondrial n=1 Tax=Roridomyces roridus TaxID=1738132 RepID=A0AAD7FUK4_9AGAR|nr:hypothetical protein FB45DRAFT_1054977 [Roridomyces roridus]
MLASRLVQTPLRKFIHTSAVRQSGHGHYNHLPFKAPFQGGRNVPFGVTLSLYLAFGFSIPFVAVKISQMKREA